MSEADSSNPDLENGSDDWKPSTAKEFLATMLHELRTPITIISGYAEILSNDDQKEHHPEAVQAISSSIERMEKLYGDMMAYMQQLMKNPDP